MRSKYEVRNLEKPCSDFIYCSWQLRGRMRARSRPTLPQFMVRLCQLQPPGSGLWENGVSGVGLKLSRIEKQKLEMISARLGPNEVKTRASSGEISGGFLHAPPVLPSPRRLPCRVIAKSRLLPPIPEQDSTWLHSFVRLHFKARSRSLLSRQSLSPLIPRQA